MTLLLVQWQLLVTWKKRRQKGYWKIIQYTVIQHSTFRITDNPKCLTTAKLRTKKHPEKCSCIYVTKQTLAKNTGRLPWETEMPEAEIWQTRLSGWSIKPVLSLWLWPLHNSSEANFLQHIYSKRCHILRKAFLSIPAAIILLPQAWD